MDRRQRYRKGLMDRFFWRTDSRRSALHFTLRFWPGLPLLWSKGRCAFALGFAFCLRGYFRDRLASYVCLAGVVDCLFWLGTTWLSRADPNCTLVWRWIAGSSLMSAVGAALRTTLQARVEFRSSSIGASGQPGTSPRVLFTSKLF